MLPFIDRPIASLMIKVLRKRSKKIIKKTIDFYIEENNPDEETIEALRDALTRELTRVCNFSDKAIIRARIKQARFVFWLTAIIGTVITVAATAFPLTTPLVLLFVPLMTAAVAYGVSVATIPYFYNERIKGAMVSATAQFEEKLHAGEQPSPEATELLVLRRLVGELREQNEDLRDRVVGMSEFQKILRSRIEELSDIVEDVSPASSDNDANFCGLALQGGEIIVEQNFEPVSLTN